MPFAEAMRANMERKRRRMFACYVAFERHTMQVDFERYLQDLAQERRVGERRARTVAGSSRAVTAGS